MSSGTGARRRAVVPRLVFLNAPGRNTAGTRSGTGLNSDAIRGGHCAGIVMFTPAWLAAPPTMTMTPAGPGAAAEGTRTLI